jgi:transposase
VQERLETLEREAHRQAAPFRRPDKKRKEQKKKPGRPSGHQPAFRQPPPTVDEAIEVPLERCPHCQGPVENVCPVEQIIEDIPEIRVRHVRLTTYRGHCPHCGPVASTHPDQVSTAVGAAGTQIGRHALALAADLNKHFGLPLRKTCAILREHFGLQLTPGGLSQALRRVARRLQVPFAQLSTALRASPAVHADETGWWLGGQSAWLWVFTNPLLTLYTIDNRSAQVVSRVLGDDYAGVLISDCLASYDPHPGRKSKCCAHHLKAISEAFEQVLESAFLTDIRALLKTAMLWHKLREEVPEVAYWTGVEHLKQRMTELLAQPLSQGPEISVAKRLLKQRNHLLTFLEVPGVAPTNNLAERQLRPAVIARKLSCGNKTESGKVTFEVLASLAATCRQQGRSFVELVAEAVSLGLPPAQLFAPG